MSRPRGRLENSTLPFIHEIPAARPIDIESKALLSDLDAGIKVVLTQGAGRRRGRPYSGSSPNSWG